MTPQEVRNEIMVRFRTEFVGQFPIALDNQKFTKPDTPTKWARLSIIFNTGSQFSLGKVGNRRFQRLGLVIVQIFTPANSGTNDNDTLAKSVVDLFDGVRISDLSLYSGRVTTVGNDGEYYQQNAVIEFDFQEIR
jgi:hypothetical protein